MPQALRRPIHRSTLVIEGRDSRGKVTADMRGRHFASKPGFPSFREMNCNDARFFAGLGLEVSFRRERGL